jgi:hypothetical protein
LNSSAPIPIFIAEFNRHSAAVARVARIFHSGSEGIKVARASGLNFNRRPVWLKITLGWVQAQRRKFFKL